MNKRKHLHSLLPEKYNVDYFIYSAIESLRVYTEDEIMKMPLRKLVKNLAFKRHDDWVEIET